MYRPMGGERGREGGGSSSRSGKDLGMQDRQRPHAHEVYERDGAGRPAKAEDYKRE